MALPALLLLAALLPPAAAQAEPVAADGCAAPVWSGLPLAKQGTPADSYDPTVRSGENGNLPRPAEAPCGGFG